MDGMRIGNDTLIAAPESLTADDTYGPVWLGHIANYSIHLTTSNTGTGSFKLQASCDQADSITGANVTNWVDIASSSQSITGGDDVLWTVENAGYNWVRVAYTHSSGTVGLDTLRFNVKGV